MKRNFLFSILILIFIYQASGNPMTKQDSIYKIWKLKNTKVIMTPGTMKSVSIDKFDLWDLTNKDTLRYTTIDSPQIVHSIPYKIIDNVISLQLPSNEQNIAIQFKVKDLTTDILSVIFHVTYLAKGKKVEDDLIELTFDAINK